MHRDNLKDQKGSVLVMAVVLSFVTIMLGVTFLTFAYTLNARINDQIGNFMANTTAFSMGPQYLEDKILGRNRNGKIAFYNDNEGWYDPVPSGSYQVGYGTGHLERIIGYGTSYYGDGEYNSSALAQWSYESYSDYLYISHRERDSLRHAVIRFWTPDTLDGKVHSNDTIHIVATSDYPLFMKKVTTTANYIDPPNNHARFLEDWGPAGKIIFPDQATDIRRYSGYNWGTIGNDSVTQIVLSGNMIRMRKCGMRHINNADSLACYPALIAGATTYPIPQSGCIFIHGKVWISASRGKVDIMDGEVPERSPVDGDFNSEGFEGKLTIGSSDTMIITDNLIYKHARTAPYLRRNSVPTTMDSCSDVLGLISERYIMMGRLCSDTMFVNAAMAAVSGSISVQDIYMNHAPGWNNEKQSLVVYGSLAQRNRGIVHTTDYPVGHLRGFIEKDYHYDVRLQNNPPPHYLPTRKLEFQFFTDDDN